MTSRRVQPIVEGHGEVEALPVLLRRLCHETFERFDLAVLKPIRVPRNRLVKDGELERWVEFASGHADQDGLVLVILDADDDCPATFGPELLERARSASLGSEVSVVLAEREYEGWFLARAASIAGQRGLRSDLADHESPETVRDAKGWLTSNMPVSTYSPTIDQAALTSTVDLEGIRTRAQSFDKLVRDLARWVASV